MQEKKHVVLIVDEDTNTRKMLEILLDTDRFKLVESTSYKQAMRMCISLKPDVILVDPALRDMTGIHIITAIREWLQVPIIVLSTGASDAEIIAALNLGANDYVTKPFNANVLEARIHATLRGRMVQEIGEPQLCNGALRMDLVRHEVFVNDIPRAFTPKEYDLLRYFMVNRGKMLTHRDILKQVWGAAHSDDTSYLRVYIGQIRDKLEKSALLPLYITTEPGIGYRMEIMQQPAVMTQAHVAA